MRGITLGTYTRWRKEHGQPAPTKAELKSISDSEVEQIYKAYFWLESGADKLAWPVCAAHFDLAVNGGVGRAEQAMNEAGPDFIKLLAWRMEWYTRISGWGDNGAGWIRRCAALLKLGA